VDSVPLSSMGHNHPVIIVEKLGEINVCTPSCRHYRRPPLGVAKTPAQLQAAAAAADTLTRT